MNLPTGTITFLFTDIEGSTRLWEAHRDAMQAAVERYDAVMRDAIAAAGGVVFKTVGDAFYAAFADAPSALIAATRAQLALRAEPWPAEIPLRVRAALHTGLVQERDNDYFGPVLNRLARLLSAGHGGQTLLSLVTYELCRDMLPHGVSLLDLGSHRLKDLERPEHVFQLAHPSLSDTFAPLRTLDRTPNNLPLQVTSFVGREEAIADVTVLLGKNHLLTLTGSGGSGKTRLGLQVAANVLDSYPDGAWLVELASLADPSLVPQAVASLLGVKEQAGQTVTQSLAEHLNGRVLLLVLDNCEHLLAACAQLVSVLIRACPSVRVLATSREPLGIGGETTFRVPSLSLPTPQQTRSATVESVSLFEAVRLFIDRALAVKQDFAVTNANAPALAEICYRLDGIPLAIELAAARVRSLTAEQVNDKLGSRFRLLTGGDRATLPRQQTLRALIDWSFDLLTEAEKKVLCRLSVFASGWTLEAAEQVCAGDGIEDWELMDFIASLCDKSLVVAAPSATSTRYHLLETIRQYALDRLSESDETSMWRDQHLAYFQALGEQSKSALLGADQIAWLERLETEHDNLRAALDWGAETGSVAGAESGLRLAGDLWRFWHVRGYLTEGRERIRRALAREKSLRGLEGGAEASAFRADALNNLGILSALQSDYASADTHYAESLAIWRAFGDRSGIARTLANRGILASQQGDYEAARVLTEESLALMREFGNRRSIANSLNNLARIAAAQDNPEEARRLYEESLEIMRELGDQASIATLLNNLGSIAFGQEDYATARVLYEDSLARMREIGNQQGIANALNNLGSVASDQKDYPAARRFYEESLLAFREIGDRLGIAFSLEGIAGVSAGTGILGLAARLWSAVERLRQELGAPLTPDDRIGYEQRVARARAAAGEEAFAAAWSSGASLTIDQAIELALSREPLGGVP